MKRSVSSFLIFLEFEAEGRVAVETQRLFLHALHVGAAALRPVQTPRRRGVRLGLWRTAHRPRMLVPLFVQLEGPSVLVQVMASFQICHKALHLHDRGADVVAELQDGHDVLHKRPLTSQDRLLVQQAKLSLPCEEPLDTFLRNCSSWKYSAFNAFLTSNSSSGRAMGRATGSTPASGAWISGSGCLCLSRLRGTLARPSACATGGAAWSCMPYCSGDRAVVRPCV